MITTMHMQIHLLLQAPKKAIMAAGRCPNFYVPAELNRHSVPALTR
jgi:hypothetical protein